MRRSTWVLTVLLLAIVIVVMFRYGLSRQPPEPAVDSTSIVESAPHRLPSPSANTVALPDQLHTLEDRGFIDALPTLERLANGGREDALRVLFDKLGSCAEYSPHSDEQIRKLAQERYLHQIEMNKRGRCPVVPDQECSPELLRDQAIRGWTERRELCAAVTPRMLDKRLELARLALARGDSSIVLMLAGPGSFRQTPPERMRNAHRLLALRRDLTEAVQRRVAGCDRRVMHRAAFGSYPRSPILALDPAAAIAYATAYDASAPDPDNGDISMAQLIADAAAQLAPAAVDQARQRGLQIVADHCTLR